MDALTTIRTNSQSVWVLPFFAGLLPAVATIVTHLISGRSGLIRS
jgi:hypothetical protein